jgi:NAD(P)-dependent dehydrogenase (short-subunit alcohol dehydrogenase family)
MSGRLAGKRVILTGGAAGIGRASAEMLVEEGARVVIGDVNDLAGNEVASALGARATYLRCDLAREADIEALIDVGVSFLGGLDVLVNNAGTILFQPISEFTVESWDRMFAINTRAHFLTMKHALPHMRAAGGGSIINMSSLAGLRGGVGGTAYSATKGAVNALTSAAAVELAVDKIRVNAICPGWIDTRFNDQAIAFMGGVGVRDEAIKTFTPLGRQGTPEEVAALVTYLASDESRFVTAQAISINGGAYN